MLKKIGDSEDVKKNRLGIGGVTVFLVSFSVPVLGGDGLHAVAKDVSRESQERSNSSSINPDKSTEERKTSPVLGGGIRKPPDVGAGGVATPTPPLETQSPTNEPEIVPPASPGLPHPSDSTIAPLDEGEPPVVSPSDEDKPLGQPDFLRK